MDGNRNTPRMASPLHVPRRPPSTSADRDTSVSFEETLLDARKNGPPPFLMRNLRYVREDRQLGRNRVWDLNWTFHNYRSAHRPRHLILTMSPSRCVIAPSTAKQFFPNTNPTLTSMPISSLSPVELTPQPAKIHLALHACQKDNRKIAFAVRQSTIRVWPRSQQMPPEALSYDDLPLSVKFDLSSYMPLLTDQLEELTLVIRITPMPPPKPPAGHATSKKSCFALIGVLRIWKAGDSQYGTAVPNASTVVQLKLSSQDFPFRYGDPNCEEVQVSAIKLDEKHGHFENSISVHVHGHVEHLTEFIQAQKPAVLVSVKYTSLMFPHWDGIKRHDFICPWCHRNCHRFRTLLSHFQVEHDHLRLSLHGMKSNRLNPETSEVPFSVHLDVTPVDRPAPQAKIKPKAGTSRVQGQPSRPLARQLVQFPSGLRPISKTESPWDDDGELYVNPQRFKSYARRARQVSESEEMSATLRTVNLDDTSDDDSTSTVIENGRPYDILSIVRDEMNYCIHCGRKHNRTYDTKSKFCSEWCLLMYKKDNNEDDGRSLVTYASATREPKINYRETLGRLQLYHIGSVSEMKESHYDEDDPDSEEEVDQSWRLDLNIERVRSLEAVSAKEKVLWMMWNKFAHENYPIPSLYGERYMRYTLERFVLEHRSEIREIKLRTQLYGFLKSLHVHGLIDSQAILSVMKCLDGIHKHRDIIKSSRPEMPLDPRSNGQGSGKARRGRRKA